ncbi:MAG: glycoside hydrolase family 99-like domain-containing protein [Sedimentisphaerales bacterium]|nr:glycoside hydrolase family 99-like domain-containing protein [Sedimentisphaerales bacterium]
MQRTVTKWAFAGTLCVLLIASTVLCFQGKVWAQQLRKKEQSDVKTNVTFGAYYFDGWSGHSRWADDPSQPWAKDAPTHLTKRMLEELPEREPIWGWRDDTAAIMEQQIDLAADHGLSFFAFCWYWHDNGKAINKKAIKEDSKHKGLELYLKASNNRRLKFCLLVANHGGYEIKGTEHWKEAADFWMPYLKHPQCFKVGGKPLLIIFNPGGGDAAGLAYLEEQARIAGLPGVAIAGCGGGSTEAGYTHKTYYNIVPGYAGGAQEHKYNELVQAHQQAWQGSPEQPCIPVVTAGWDKRPWEGPTGLSQQAGYYFPDRTPEQFADFLKSAISWMDKHPEQATAERIALIYAWNEFGEGGYIAPTKGDPEGKYLAALRSVLANETREITGQPKEPTGADNLHR